MGVTGWDLLPRIVLLLAAAAVAGLLLQRLRQSVIVGYLLAGVVLGPTVLGVVRPGEDVTILSELGVALLLFSIGLEFSLARLRELGRVAVGAGALQIAGTAVLVSIVAHQVGTSGPAAVVIGMAFAMSSTAVVLRGLTERAELDSTHGRNAIGMLLFQDLAVIPILIATDALSTGMSGGASGLLAQFLVRAGFVVLFIAGAWATARLLLPRVLSAAVLSGSRDLPVVIAVCTSIGAAWGAHSLGFSPTLGAFLAGLVLAESPFATEIRADLAPLTAVFVTLFFASIGTAVNLPVEPRYIAVLITAALGVMLAKTLITAASVWLWERSLRTALITGIFISQVGEFTFVVAETAHRAGLISSAAFQFTLGISLLTLIATPYGMSAAPLAIVRLLRRLPADLRVAVEGDHRPRDWRRVIVIGFGPAGQQVVQRLSERRIPFLVLDMNPNTVSQHRSTFKIELGDATSREVLQHLGVGRSLSVVVTVPDPVSVRLICAAVQRLAPGVPIVARSRYHQYRDALFEAGADRVVDEEYFVGVKLADEALASLGAPRPGALKSQPESAS